MVNTFWFRFQPGSTYLDANIQDTVKDTPMRNYAVQPRLNKTFNLESNEFVGLNTVSSLPVQRTTGRRMRYQLCC